MNLSSNKKLPKYIILLFLIGIISAPFILSKSINNRKQSDKDYFESSSYNFDGYLTSVSYLGGVVYIWEIDIMNIKIKNDSFTSQEGMVGIFDTISRKVTMLVQDTISRTYTKEPINLESKLHIKVNSSDQKIFIENKHNTLPLSPIYLYDYKKYLLYLENEHTIRF